tara:strand:+ start:9084 stop:9593 length:510 start_codon:yes stop_codon:yes gene_type:complete
MGAFWYRQRLPPLPLLKKVYEENSPYYRRIKSIPSYKEAQLTYSKYKSGVLLYLDRSYVDTIGDDRLDGLFLIQINRHETQNIILKTNSPITIYRLVPEKNSGLNHQYEKTNIKVMVKGVSTTNLVDVVKKKFKSGNIILSPGGPITAAPILFSTYGQKIPNIIIQKTY